MSPKYRAEQLIAMLKDGKFIERTLEYEEYPERDGSTYTALEDTYYEINGQSVDADDIVDAWNEAVDHHGASVEVVKAAWWYTKERLMK